MSEQMGGRLGLPAFFEAFLFGTVVLVGLWEVIGYVSSIGPFWLDEVLLIVWLAVIAVTVAGVGIRRVISPSMLLSGVLAGWIIGFAAYTWVQGGGILVTFILILLFGTVPIVLGTAGTYAARR